MYIEVYGHFGPKTVRIQVILALCLVPKCLKFLRWCTSAIDTSAPVPKCLGQFGTIVHETLRTQNKKYASSVLRM